MRRVIYKKAFIVWGSLFLYGAQAFLRSENIAKNNDKPRVQGLYSNQGNSTNVNVESPNSTAAPFDGGLSVLIAVGIGYGIKRGAAKKEKKKGVLDK